jgi:putative membrane protein
VDKLKCNSGNPVIQRAYCIISFKILFWIEEVETPETPLMGSILADSYLWVKSFHVMAVIAWMAGLFYMPRLFVYHAERSALGPEMDDLFQTMEFKLYRVIMGPAAIATWAFGLVLVMTPGIVDWSAVWPWTKAAAVLGMTWFHHWLGARRKDFGAGRNRLTGRHYRMMNEVPTVLMLVIVLSVIVRF